MKTMVSRTIFDSFANIYQYENDGFTEWYQVKSDIALTICGDNKDLFFEQRIKVGNEFFICRHMKDNTFVDVYDAKDNEDYLPEESNKAYIRIDGFKDGWYSITPALGTIIKNINVIIDQNGSSVRFSPEFKMGFNVKELDSSISNLFKNNPLLQQNSKDTPQVMFVDLELEVV